MAPPLTFQLFKKKKKKKQVAYPKATNPTEFPNQWALQKGVEPAHLLRILPVYLSPCARSSLKWEGLIVLNQRNNLF